MKVWDASTSISAEFGGIRDLSRHLSLNSNTLSLPHLAGLGLVVDFKGFANDEVGILNHVPNDPAAPMLMLSLGHSRCTHLSIWATTVD